MNLASWLKSPIGRLASLAIPGAAALSVIGFAEGSLHSVSPDTGVVALDAPVSKMALKLTTDFDLEQLSRTLGQDVAGISSLGGDWVCWGLRCWQASTSARGLCAGLESTKIRLVRV